MEKMTKPTRPPHPQPVVPLRLVLAEDDDQIREPLSQILALDGFEVTAVPDGEMLVDHLSRCDAFERRPDVIVTDHRMPGYSGVEVLEGLRDAGWRIPVIVVTAYGPEVTPLARALGAFAVLQKPIDLDDLRTAVLCSVEWSRREVEAPAGKRSRRARGLTLVQR
jgi:two-component system, response regulator, stage 0 sporulation protein F